MRKLLLITVLCTFLPGFGQNLLINGNFQAETQNPWMGFNNQIRIDELSNSQVGNVNNGEGSFYQIVNLQAGQTYTVAFDYRWVIGMGGYNMRNPHQCPAAWDRRRMVIGLQRRIQHNSHKSKQMDCQQKQ